MAIQYSPLQLYKNSTMSLIDPPHSNIFVQERKYKYRLFCSKFFDKKKYPIGYCTKVEKFYIIFVNDLVNSCVRLDRNVASFQLNLDVDNKTEHSFSK